MSNVHHIGGNAVFKPCPIPKADNPFRRLLEMATCRRSLGFVSLSSGWLNLKARSVLLELRSARFYLDQLTPSIRR